MRSIYDKHNIYVSTPDWFKDADLTQSSQTSGTIQPTSTGTFVSSSTDFKSIPIDNQTIVWENELLHVPIDNDKLIIKDGKLTVSSTSTGGDDPVDGDYVTIKGDQNVEGLKTFEKGIKIGEYALSNPQTDVVYLDANLVVRGGIVMYAQGSDINVPSIYEGLPIDDNTLKWVDTISDDGTVISVLSVNPEIDLGGASTWDELDGKPTWITVTKPRWDYENDVYNKPNLSIYATLDYVNGELEKYVTLGTTQTITGEKNFTGGLKVNGGPIVYNATNKYWKLEGDLLITGGVTMYGNDSDFESSTIMDAIQVDGTTISKDGGILKVIGGTSGSQNNVQIVSSLPAESNRTPNTLYIIIG